MSKKELNTVDEPIVDENVTYAPYEAGQLAAKIVKDGEDYFVTDLEGNIIGEALKTINDNSKAGVAFVLPKNPSNRKWYNKGNTDKAIDEHGFCALTYKPTKVLGPVGSRSTALPNAKLISYLSEEEQEEYKAIIARAIEARDADKKKPMTELEKAKAAAERANAKLAKLLEEAQGGNN